MHFQAYAQKTLLEDELYFRLLKAVTSKLNRTLAGGSELGTSILFSVVESTDMAHLDNVVAPRYVQT
jgi:hypothetical protein